MRNLLHCRFDLHDFDVSDGSGEEEKFPGQKFTEASSSPVRMAAGTPKALTLPAQLYLTRWVGVTGDFSGVYNSGANLYTYTSGPVVRPHSGSFSPYAHALFGGARAGGGGVSSSGSGDAVRRRRGLRKTQAVFRAVQFDWMVLRFSGITDKNNMRVNTGVLYRF